MYRLKEGDVNYLIIACRAYQHHTNSEYLWEKYENLIEKLNLYQEQNLYATGMEHSCEGALNAPIHNTLKAIDNHTQEYFKSGDKWHLEKADQLRQYLHELKTWIHKQEGR